VSKPGWPQGGPPDAGKPQLYDKAPPQWTGVPIERDPVSGRLLSGDPLGRGDKGRSAHSPGKTALVAGAAVAVVAAAVITVLLVTGGNDPEPDPTATAGAVTSEPTTSAAPTTTEPAVETGPRDIPITMTITAITVPPGFAQDPTYGTAGDVRPRTWTITGACDGTGPCGVQHCRAPGDCNDPFTGQPQGSGYVAKVTGPVEWDAPECTGGTVTATITWAFGGEAENLTLTGTWVEEAPQVLFTGSDGRDCGVYLTELQFTSP
jgi:hypothetical protein